MQGRAPFPILTFSPNPEKSAAETASPRSWNWDLKQTEATRQAPVIKREDTREAGHCRFPLTLSISSWVIN